jgi:hypothetical protein
LESGPKEEDAYKPLVELCNQVLTTAREEDLAAKLDEHLRPEKGQIEFIRYDKLPLAYDWVSKPSRRGKPPKQCLVTVKPDILVVMKDAIANYKANQAAVTEKVFDPSAPAVASAPCRIGLKDVLGCVELKWTRQPNRELKPPPVPQTSAGEYSA